MITIPELDELTITIVVDNTTDTLSSIAPGVPQVPEIAHHDRQDGHHGQRLERDERDRQDETPGERAVTRCPQPGRSVPDGGRAADR